MTEIAPSPNCTVYFDGGCPVCSREIAWYQARVGEGVSFIDVSPSDAPPAADLDREAALARFHVRRADGTLVSGARGFIELWRAVPALRPIAAVASFAPITWVLEMGYRGFLVVRKAWR